jgi:hypothetical protein
MKNAPPPVNIPEEEAEPLDDIPEMLNEPLFPAVIVVKSIQTP